MPKTIKTIDEIRPNVFEALKRAYIKRGIVPRRYHSKDTSPEEIAAQSEPKSKSKQKPKTQTAKSTIDDGSEKTDEKPGIKQSSPDSKSAKGPETLTELTENSQDILYEATTVFPFTPFPDSITLDREKLTIASRYFWRMANITSTPVSEIMTVEATVGPFFGSIHLTFRFFADNQRNVNFLWRHDATNLQRLLHGYIIAHRREIDCSNVPLEDLKKMLMELGQGATD